MGGRKVERMAGRRRSEERARADESILADGNVRASFIPFINSRAGISSQDEDEDEDEGLFRELENGDVLEVGSIRNPATGLVQEYEEVWRRILQAPENEASVVIIERVASNEPRALVGRIGAWEVGMRDASPTEPFMAWRCDQDEVTGEWKEVYSIGGEVARIRRLIPRIPPLVSPSRGEKLVLAGKEWLVRENS